MLDYIHEYFIALDSDICDGMEAFFATDFASCHFKTSDCYRILFKCINFVIKALICFQFVSLVTHCNKEIAIELWVFDFCRKTITSVAFSGDGKYLATGEVSFFNFNYLNTVDTCNEE